MYEQKEENTERSELSAYSQLIYHVILLLSIIYNNFIISLHIYLKHSFGNVYLWWKACYILTGESSTHQRTLCRKMICSGANLKKTSMN